MKALINTKSNFRELNGTIQEVYEIVGNRVTCSIFLPDLGKEARVDFGKSEVKLIEE